MKYGYARVSTDDQNSAFQLAALNRMTQQELTDTALQILLALGQ